MYMLIKLASEATKRPWLKAPLLQWMHSMWTLDTTVHVEEAVVYLAFTDGELRAVLWFYYSFCIAIEW